MIKPLDIYNLDGFGNASYYDENDVACLERYVDALQEKLNEVIDLLATDSKPSTGTSNAPITTPRRPMSKQPDKELREDLKLELLDWLGDRYSGAADMPYEEIVRLNDISLNVTLNNLENIVTKAQLQLVDELMDYSCEFGAELIQDGQRIVEAVPTEVLQQYKANLSGKGE